MTENIVEQAESAPESVDNDENVIKDGSSERPDSLLVAILRQAAKNEDAGVGITLTVGGALITGTAVGPRAWWKSLRRDLGPASTFIEGLGEIMEDRYEGVVVAEGWEPSTVYLTDAHYIRDGGDLPSGGLPMHWRGRINSVDGWSFGILNRA